MKKMNKLVEKISTHFSYEDDGPKRVKTVKNGTRTLAMSIENTNTVYSTCQQNHTYMGRITYKIHPCNTKPYQKFSN